MLAMNLLNSIGRFLGRAFIRLMTEKKRTDREIFSIAFLLPVLITSLDIAFRRDAAGIYTSDLYLIRLEIVILAWIVVMNAVTIGEGFVDRGLGSVRGFFVKKAKKMAGHSE